MNFRIMILLLADAVRIRRFIGARENIRLTRPDRSFNEHLYLECNLVERVSSNQCRCIATQCGTLAVNHPRALFELASILIGCALVAPRTASHCPARLVQ
jgi:hypothetical protein